MTTPEFVASLAGMKDVTGAWKRLEGWLHRGERAILVEIARGCVGAGLQEWQKRSIRDKITELLALQPGRENIAATLEIGEFMPHRAPLLAEMLTQNQSFDELMRWFEAPASGAANRDFLVLIAQEMVLRGADLRATAVRHWWKELELSGHELSTLPLFQLECEAGFAAYRRHYGSHGSSYSFPPAGQRLALCEAGETPTATEIECDAERMASAVANWCEESNGQSEARCFALSAPVTSFGPQTLAQFPLKSARDARAAGLLPVDFPFALAELFAAAANGGAYNSGEHGARGRLRTWQSVAALCGTSARNPVEILEVAQGCKWFEFTGASPWFYNVAWDLGLICLRGGRQSVAVLSATDTD